MLWGVNLAHPHPVHPARPELFISPQTSKAKFVNFVVVFFITTQLVATGYTTRRFIEVLAMHLRILLSEITQRRYRFSKNENNIETLICVISLFFILQCLSKTTLFSRTVKIKILASSSPLHPPPPPPRLSDSPQRQRM